MKAILAACVAALGLSGCTAGDVTTLRELTIEDGARYVNENHERRRDIRKQLYALEDEIISKCIDRARALEGTGDAEGAEEWLAKCFAFLESAYPDLATFKALKEGQEQFNELRGTP